MEAKEALGANVSLWEEHFRALRETVAGVFTGKPGHPAPTYLLRLAWDMSGTFLKLIEEEERRALQLDRSGPSWFRTYQPCPWDWEVMRPALPLEVVSAGEGLRPSHLEEAATWLALSKGLVWIYEGETKKAALLHGLDGLRPRHQ